MSNYCTNCKYSKYRSKGDGIFSSNISILCCENPTVREYRNCNYDDKLKVNPFSSCKLFQPKLTADDIGFKK
ncbi:MAG TPA: hypothetical protein PLZ09_00130 [Clostridia bacterium]|nr:hypothetical protein [Clostridia bacterium]